VRDIFRFLFAPDLSDSNLQQEIQPGIQGQHIVFTIQSEKGFWSLLVWEHSSNCLLAETKNSHSLTNEDIYRIADNLGNSVGALGFIVGRAAPSRSALETTYAIYERSYRRKVVLILSDIDLRAMLELRGAGADPLNYIQTLYRGFRASVQR
jgi:hypothetical protein